MRVVMLSWEYPPMRVGGIAAALEGLAPALARAGVEVHVVTSGTAGGAPEEQEATNLFIHRVPVADNSNDFFHWVHLLNAQMEYRADALIRGWQDAGDTTPILLHVHDWLGLFAGKTLKNRFHLPLVSTIHATEYGRNNGIYSQGQRYINGCEWELQYESWRVIVCSEFMRGEVMYALGTPFDKLDVVYNGVDAHKFDSEFVNPERDEFRARFGTPNEKIIFFIGRMVREKGPHLLVEAHWRVLQQYNDAKMVIAGGGERGHLERRARELGISDRIFFTGRISDADRDRLYKVADVAVYPSLYEPFGIVALEAMAAHVPVIVSAAGGLAEVVEDGVTGIVTPVENVDYLANSIAYLLKNPQIADAWADAAQERCRTIFNWDRIAVQTEEVYRRVWNEYSVSDWAKNAP